MKHLDQSAMDLLSNRLIFEEIHQLKSYFTSLFSEVANEISLSHLKSIHPTSQGTKISKGNELESCPYQVLDIVRDFDRDLGFNIRLLNWWGRGLFVLVFLGKDHSRLSQENPFLIGLQHEGFQLGKTSSPWDYPKLIDEGLLGSLPRNMSLESHLDEFGHFQVVKKINYSERNSLLKESLKEQVDQILYLYVGNLLF